MLVYWVFAWWMEIIGSQAVSLFILWSLKNITFQAISNLLVFNILIFMVIIWIHTTPITHWNNTGRSVWLMLEAKPSPTDWMAWENVFPKEVCSMASNSQPQWAPFISKSHRLSLTILLKKQWRVCVWFDVGERAINLEVIHYSNSPIHALNMISKKRKGLFLWLNKDSDRTWRC